MKRTLRIEGMSCQHCAGRVERALAAMPGVKATVDLAAKTATVEAPESVSDEALERAVIDAGYEVVK
jgi:Cu+-exporting ATPase